jgi:hydrogenase expression/formation protein HypD
VRFLDEYRDPKLARRLVEEVRRAARRRWTVMEVCGGQTHTILKFGIDELLKEAVEFVHGPGCPVCVTPVVMLDKAIRLAEQPGVILATFGDMARVPGSSGDLLQTKARGADVRIVYSPLDALRLAEENPERRVVFFAIGFETTAPANAMAVWLAKRKRLRNFLVLSSHLILPPAIRAILSDPELQVQGLIAPGHVCTVAGYMEYEKIAREYGVPFVVSGFEPLDLLEGTYMLVRLLEEGKAEVQNQYSRSATREGNREAQRLMEEVFELTDREWRGLGVIPGTGLRLRKPYREFDAELAYDLGDIQSLETGVCIAGAVLQGKSRPVDCPAFGRECTPEHPLGAPMVSSEGSCAAYYAYRREAANAP